MAGSGSEVVGAGRRVIIVSGQAFDLLKNIIECPVGAAHSSGHVNGWEKLERDSGYDFAFQRAKQPIVATSWFPTTATQGEWVEPREKNR